MDRHSVAIRHGDLAAARGALDAVGIPSVAVDETAPPRRRFAEFLSNRGFVILAVIGVAFFAQRVLADDDDPKPVSYSYFLATVERIPQEIVCVNIDPDDTTLTIQQKSGVDLSTAYPPSAEADLVDTLESKDIQTNIEPSGGGSGIGLAGFLGLVLLFFGLWFFKIRRGRRELEELRNSVPKLLVADVVADNHREAIKKVERVLPAGVERYEVSPR